MLGQNVNSYKAGDVGFRGLLERVSDCEGLTRVRFTSPHPKDWDNALADLMAQRANICNHLHLPFQAGSNRILELMRRRHAIEDYLEKVHYLRNVNPGVEITTDTIVGFPTETEADFEQTLQVIREVQFSQIFSFKYSPRPGTRAADMEDDVPRPVKEERLQRLIALQEDISNRQMAACVGTVQDVLIDSVNPRMSGAMNGRTDGYRPVTVKASGLNIGDLVRVNIKSWRNHWLEGELTGQ